MQKNDMLFDYIAQCVKPQGKSDLMMLMEYDRWSSDWESGKQCVGDNGNLFDLVGYLFDPINRRSSTSNQQDTM